MPNETIKTGVDDFLELLKRVSKIPLAEAAQNLGISLSLAQAWTDFLVEEEIVGIEYKFTKPIIYINKMPEHLESNIEEDNSMSLDAYKNDFTMRASEKSIPPEKLSFFWKNHVKDTINSRKEFFIREARKRNLPNIDMLWQAYINRLLNS